MNKVACLGGALLGVACGSGSAFNGGAGNPDAAPQMTSIDAGNNTIREYTVTIGPIDVAPLEEKTLCVVKSLGNPDGARIGKLHNVLGPTSHHMVVYRTADTIEKPEPFACLPFVDTLDPSKGAPLMITQKAEELLELPPGVAYTLAANQMVRLELHYINTSDSPLQVMASSTFTSIPDDAYQNEADFLFIGNPDIRIPPHQKFTLGPSFMQLSPQFDDAHFFAVTGHEHHWGTDVKVWSAPSAAGPDTSVYDVPNWLWSEPATVFHDPPFQIAAGGGFRFTCTWENQSDHTVSIGESANDEMCFFWAYYYPSHGALVCFHTDRLSGGGYDLCCPGNPYCNVILSMFGH